MKEKLKNNSEEFKENSSCVVAMVNDVLSRESEFWWIVKKILKKEYWRETYTKYSINFQKHLIVHKVIILT